jgi:Holliday junction resolvasome RuvABC endonuclease subunit
MPSLSRILALDLGSRTGWAILEHGRREHGAEDFAPLRHESKGMRWLKFRRWFEYMVGDKGRPDLVVFERWVSYRTGASAEITAGFTTRTVEYCDERKLEYTAISPTDLKRWATGKGNAGKPAMKDAVQRKFQIRIDDDNEADAYLLLRYAEELYP